MSETSDRPLEEVLIRAARRILRPLVRILLRNGISANTFQEVARKVFVDVAYEEFSIEGKTQTLARVSVITGLNRKEVARLHNLDPVDERDRAWRNRAAIVMSSWFSDEEFLDPAGEPLDLPFAGQSPTFSDLVKRHSGDMYPRAVADELLRLGAIVDVGGRYRMARHGYMPSGDPSMLIDILGIDASEFIETIDHNLQETADAKRLLQLKVLADNLPAEHVPAFLEFSRGVGLEALEKVTRWLNDHDAGSDRSGADARYAAGLGVFQITRLVRPESNEAEEPKS